MFEFADVRERGNMGCKRRRGVDKNERQARRGIQMLKEILRPRGLVEGQMIPTIPASQVQMVEVNRKQNTVFAGAFVRNKSTLMLAL